MNHPVLHTTLRETRSLVRLVFGVCLFFVLLAAGSQCPAQDAQLPPQAEVEVLEDEPGPGADSSAQNAAQATRPLQKVQKNDVPLLRTPKEGFLEQYLQSKDYRYDRPKPKGEELRDGLMAWLRSLFAPKSPEGIKRRREVNSSWYKYLLYTIVGVAIILLLSQTINFRNLFYGRGAEAKLVFAELEENIHEINFDDLIAYARKAGEYRKLIRLRYLKLLKELSEARLIEWRPEKTNAEYVQEIPDKRLKRDFARLKRVFDYVWYGEMSIDKKTADRAWDLFEAVSSRIANYRGRRYKATPAAGGNRTHAQQPEFVGPRTK